MSSFDQVVFGKKTFGDILKEIYENQKHKSKQVNEIVKTMQDMVDDENASIEIFLPHIKNCLEVGIKNDDNLIKAAGIIQRVLSGGSTSEDFNLSKSEKEELIRISRQAAEEGS